MSDLEIPDDGDDEQRFAAQARELLDRAERSGLNEALEQLGIHPETGAIWPAPTGPVLVVSGYLGPLAFTDRVQDPDKLAMDDTFAGIAEQFVNDTYEEKRRRLLDGLD